MYIANLEITHKNTPHNVLSSFTLQGEDLEKFYKRLVSQKDISEAIILQTCNRFEIYFRGQDEAHGMTQAKSVMFDWFGENTGKYLVFKSYLGTLTHLLKLVASLDSMIVGENQIQVQVREALDYAQANKFSGMVLDTIFMKALAVGKKVRTETRISDGKVSISSAAVDLAAQHDSIENKKVIVIGSGIMAGLLAKYLSDLEYKELVVIGRTPERVEKFCCDNSGRPSNFADLPKELKNADLLFSATSSPHVLVTKEIIENTMSGREKPITLIDIAMPDDIDPLVSTINNVQYFCIDDLKDISEKNKAKRLKEIEKAEEIIDNELEVFKKHLQSSHIERFLSPLNKYVNDLRERELNRALEMLKESDPKTKEIFEGFSKTLTKKIMHNFMSEIRNSQTTGSDMERFVEIFLGNGNVSTHPHAKTKK